MTTQLIRPIYIQTTLTDPTDPNLTARIGTRATPGPSIDPSQDKNCFETPDTYHPHPGALMLAVSESGTQGAPGTGTITVTVFLFVPDFTNTFGSGGPPNPPLSTDPPGTYVPIKKATLITEGTPLVIPNIPAYAKLYVEITATANTPKALLGWFVTN